MKIKYAHQEIGGKRRKVRANLVNHSSNITGGEIKRISNLDLKLLFEQYDTHFLKGYFSKQFKGELQFSLSNRMTKSAGKTQSPRNIKELSPEQEQYEIKIGTGFIFNYGHLEREKKVNGLQSRDALDALQLVFEHEICHLVELHCCKESSCSRDRFKTLAFNLFGHTEIYHHLPTTNEIAAVKYGFAPGVPVRFVAEGKLYRGIIHRINKRATVMVPAPEGVYQDTQGNKYNKWYVPLPALEITE